MKTAVLEALSARDAERRIEKNDVRRETLLADVLLDMRAQGALSQAALEQDAVNFVPSGVHTSGLRMLSWRESSIQNYVVQVHEGLYLYTNKSILLLKLLAQFGIAD